MAGKSVTGIGGLSSDFGDCQSHTILEQDLVFTVWSVVRIVDSDQVRTKELYDPRGLLNPGKLKGWDGMISALCPKGCISS